MTVYGKGIQGGMYEALEIANFFLATADVHDATIDPLKLQKLLYYAQGFSLAIRGEALFEDEFEAWPHGPVVPSVYHHFKRFGRGAIDPPDETEFDWDQIDDEEVEDLLDEVWEEFGQYSGWALRDMTHAEPPWKKGHQRVDQRISRRSMATYFKARVKG